MGHEVKRLVVRDMGYGGSRGYVLLCSQLALKRHRACMPSKTLISNARALP